MDVLACIHKPACSQRTELKQLETQGVNEGLASLTFTFLYIYLQHTSVLCHAKENETRSSKDDKMRKRTVIINILVLHQAKQSSNEVRNKGVWSIVGI